MKALILSCGTGGGHNSAGAAVKEELLRRGHDVTMLSPYDLKGGRLSDCVDNTYISIAQRTPKLFGAIYAAGNWYRSLPWRSPVYFVNGRMAETMRAFLEENAFDVVLMPHIFPAEILTYMRNHGMRIPKTVLIATDYSCIPFMEECVCDAYIIPSEKLKADFVGRGIPADRIYPFGIPVRSGFRQDMSRDEAKTQLGLDLQKRYILIAGGSMGAGKLEEVLQILHQLTSGTDLRPIAICGSNQILLRKLQARFGSQMEILGRTDQIAVYLRASELYLTKPGGLSTTEAAVTGVPLGLLPPIPGCESINLRFFVENGMCRTVGPSVQSLNAILDLIHCEDACKEMVARQHQVIPQDAAQQICDLACRLAR